jgi:hypothetical protein
VEARAWRSDVWTGGDGDAPDTGHRGACAATALAVVIQGSEGEQSLLPPLAGCLRKRRLARVKEVECCLPLCLLALSRV